MHQSAVHRLVLGVAMVPVLTKKHAATVQLTVLMNQMRTTCFVDIQRVEDRSQQQPHQPRRDLLMIQTNFTTQIHLTMSRSVCFESNREQS